MTLFFTNFSEYAVNQAPADWTERWEPTSFTELVVARAGSVSGKALAITKSAQAVNYLSWDDVGNNTDIEILALTNAGYIHARAVAGSTKTGYHFYIGSATSRVLYKIVNSSATSLGTSTASKTGILWTRFRIQGTALKVKTWMRYQAEPETWDIEVTDSEIANGTSVGVGAVWSSGVTSYVEVFAAETDSGAWPIPVADSVTDFSLDLAVQANAFDYFKMTLEVLEGAWIEDFKLSLDVVAQVIDSFKMLLEVVLNKIDDFKMLLEVTDGTVFDDFAMLLDVVDGTVFDNFKMELSVVSATPAFRSVTAHRLSSVLSEVV